MTQKTYLTPEVKTIVFHPEGVLAASVMTEIGGVAGEDVTFGEEFNPWN